MAVVIFRDPPNIQAGFGDIIEATGTRIVSVSGFLRTEYIGAFTYAIPGNPASVQGVLSTIV
jgi:hypothetical protein